MQAEQTLTKLHNTSFIDGEWVAATNTELEVINPATGEGLGTVGLCGQEEVVTAAEDFIWNAEQAKRLYGEIISLDRGTDFSMTKEPVGVVAAITPWNFPFSMISRKVAPALAAGCSVVLKPAQDTPFTAISLFEIFAAAGLPKGVANLVVGNEELIGKAFCDSPLVRKVTFTGSTAVGKLLYAQSAATLKSLSMELGGNAPFIICADADIDDAVEKFVAGKLRNNGQVCTSPSRLFIEAPVYKQVLDSIIQKLKIITIGNGLEENVQIGPMIREKERGRLQKLIDDAVEKGATVLLGEEEFQARLPKEGFFFYPVVLEGITPEMRLFAEEIFGLVVPVFSFQSLDEVLEIANSTPYGLAAYIFTKNTESMHVLSEQLQFGVIGINSTAIADQRAPFGGVKESGFGRENGEYGIEEFLIVKTKRIEY